MLFQTRAEAGRALAAELETYRHEPTVVLGIATGGVPIASEIAQTLCCPLDVWVVRKLRPLGDPTASIGAVAEGGAIDLDPLALRPLRLDPGQLETLISRGREEVDRQVAALRSGRNRISIFGVNVIVVDDGVLSGASARAAMHSIRAQEPKRLIFAVPLGSASTLDTLHNDADEVVCLHPRRDRSQADAWGSSLDSVSDEEVRQILANASGTRPSLRLATTLQKPLPSKGRARKEPLLLAARFD